jgi:Ca2+-binding EF-hand superfamily protein
MYKNAEQFVNEKAKVNKQAIRNAVSVSRIEQNVRKVQTMTHLIQPPTHDEVILPKAQTSVLERHDEEHISHHDDNRMRIRLMKSAAMVPMDAAINARPLDPDSINDWVKRVKEANDNQDVSFYARSSIGSRKKKKREVISQAQVIAIEQKLSAAIRSEFRIFQQQNKAANGSSSMMDMHPTQMPTDNRATSAGNGGGPAAAPGSASHPRRPSMISAFADDDEKDDEDDDDHDDGKAAISAIATAHAAEGKVAAPTPTSPTKQEKFVLTTRHLLPYYKLEAVHQFMDIFAKVDENFSGDLDVNEWIKLFSSLNESVTEQEARMIFMKIDKDSNGFLTMRELIPVVFNKATKEQQRMIIQYTEMELTKKMDLDHTPKVTNTDLEFLFEAYDTENVGFVEIALIRERIRSLRLPEQVLFYFMELTTDLADDEMVNLVEFKRLFKPFTSTQKRRGTN